MKQSSSLGARVLRSQWRNRPQGLVSFFYLEKAVKVLVVSDSKDLCQTVSLILKVRWAELSLVHATEARESLDLIHREQPDIVMLHLPERSEGSPTLDYFDLITRIRSFSDVPLIVLSQSNDVVDKIRVLEMGADDWISLSSIPMEFIAKVSAILRRCRPRSSRSAFSSLDGKLSINFATREVFISAKQVKLTPIEYKILCHLAENQGSVVSSAELLRHVWGPNYQDDKETLKISIHRLRSKIEEDSADPQIVLCERGVGYIIRSPHSS